MGQQQKKISIEQVRHVAELARLELTPAEEERLQADLSAILDHVAQLDALDTSAVEPTAQVAEAGTPFRDDVVINHPAPEEMLANAPARDGTLFKVPKIIE